MDLMHIFSYYKREMESLHLLATKALEAQTDFEQARIALNNEREGMVRGPKERWDLTIEQIGRIRSMENKEEVMQFLLPERQREVNYLKIVYGHFLLNLNREKKRLSRFYSVRFEQHFKGLAERNIDFLADYAMMINLLNTQL